MAQRQAALVRALVEDGPVPSGFDPAAIASAGEVCRHKRDAHAGAGAPTGRFAAFCAKVATMLAARP